MLIVTLPVYDSSKQIKVIQLIPILQDVPLDLARVDPSNQILHIPRDEKRRICNDFRACSNVALLDELVRLVAPNHR